MTDTTLGHFITQDRHHLVTGLRTFRLEEKDEQGKKKVRHTQRAVSMCGVGNTPADNLCQLCLVAWENRLNRGETIEEKWSRMAKRLLGNEINPADDVEDAVWQLEFRLKQTRKEFEAFKESTKENINRLNTMTFWERICHVFYPVKF